MADVALDDYIKTANVRTMGRGKGRGRPSLRGKAGGAAFGAPKRLQDARSLLDRRINNKMRMGDARQQISLKKKANIGDARQLLSGRRGGMGARGGGRGGGGQVMIPRVSVQNDQYRAPQKPVPQLLKKPMVRVRQLKQLTGAGPARLAQGGGRTMLQRTIPNRQARAPRIEMIDDYEDMEDDDNYREPSLSDDDLELERLAYMNAAVAQRRAARRSPPRRAEMPMRRAPPPPREPEIGGFRVEITNLHSGVTKEDIFELFTSIGPLRRCTMTRPGKADVIFSKKEDAMAAERRYNNRELDGQPMMLRVIDSSSSSRGAVQGAPRRRMDPDSDAVRSALFRRSGRSGIDFQVSI